jgi:hypothetical protein
VLGSGAERTLKYFRRMADGKRDDATELRRV